MLHSVNCVPTVFHFLASVEICWRVIISNSLRNCSLPCNFLTHFLAIQVHQRIVKHTPKVQRSVVTLCLCEVSWFVISNLYDSAVVINPNIWFSFVQDIGNDSLNRSAEMMEIDARLNALQKFMKENMPWSRDASALHLSDIIISRVSTIITSTMFLVVNR